ncbi:DNA-binding FadR family transcriptional regulator [Hephaestia caeni]|uniref:DNA-binding FadR family transcriptional regulator n=1 Tax=Hephaestia caeni TaxID=645617 RepID=A0A397P7M6_9SPHN|nr:FadR/GntR family transcriptional regulator [Hephaestia caeni]RIA45546.1 DNA-binding FadR family transcriptional regulator [Hephaestia caeni]
MANIDTVARPSPADEFTPPRPVTLAERVYDQLAGLIAENHYGPSGKLPSEHELARTFDVSRPVVRDALRRLRTAGVIYSRQGAGSFVVGTPAEKTSLAFRPAETIADVQRCYEFRETIETIAVALAANRRNQAILDQLEAIVRRFQRATASNTHSEELDFEFHLTIARASNNQYFPTVMMALREQIAAGMRLHGLALMSPTGRLEQSTEEHIAILDAIRRQDSAAATERMRLHIRNSRDRLFGGGLLDLSM